MSVDKHDQMKPGILEQMAEEMKSNNATGPIRHRPNPPSRPYGLG